ncbi:hypothetical protein Ciccas_003647 [Cichlidogyrus casuarinus]|uniref:Protein kinase domain-containing protein n=1 Tax=Cichlidogyrus casuarinus TaxID=1844966 RepID=A0ABD2QDU1_9PLAT
MEYLKKVKNTVTQNLPGNPITREYEVKEVVGTLGPDFLWRIHSAQKKSTKQEASVWIMEKKQLDQYGKQFKEPILDMLKRGVQNLTRIRHPKIVSVVNSLEESRESLCFATEPIFTSLANALHLNKNLPSEIIEKLENFDFHDVEVKHGVQQIVESLIFLHNDCKQLHGNISPNSIVINRLGCWKLAGLEFLTSLSLEDPFNSKFTYFIDNDLPVQKPFLPFCSPEITSDGLVGSSIDMYALGMLIYTLHNKGSFVNNCGDSLFDYKRNLEKIKDMTPDKLPMVPDSIMEFAFMLINHNPRVRPDAHQLKKAGYFIDPCVSALQSLDDLYQLDNLAKSQFYKTLPQLIANMPKRVCIFRILPQLCDEFNNPNMIPFVLPAVLLILDLSDQSEFDQYILPKIIPVLAMKEPIQNLSIVLKKMSKADFSVYGLPLICSSLDSDDKQITQLCLDELPIIGEQLDFKVMKSHIFPKMRKLCISTNITSVKLAVLICIGKLLQSADKWFVIDDILPFLPDLRSRDPAILMAIYGLYRIILNHRKLGLTREAIANKVLPHVIPLSVDLNLNLKQYQAYAELIRDLCAELEKSQKEKLKQSGKVDEEAEYV